MINKMKLVKVERTPEDSRQKLIATFKDDEGKIKTVSFGIKESLSYIDGASDKVREAYLARHQRDIINNDPTTKGNLSYYITWGDSRSLSKNVSAYKRRFGI